MTMTVKSTGEDLPGVMLSLGGAEVQVAQFTGARDRQEDTFMLASGVPIKPGEERRFLEISIGRAAEDTKHFAHGGSAVAAALFTPDRVVHAAGLGDCEFNLYIRNRENGDVTGLRVTREHTLNNPDERARIMGNAATAQPTNPDNPVLEGENGSIFLYEGGDKLLDRQTGSVMSLTRGCGNTAFAGMTGELDPEKDVRAVDLKQWPADKFDVYGEVCCDGLARKSGGDLTLTERVNYVQALLKIDPNAHLADALTNFALQNGSRDNCTSVVFKVPQKMDGNLCLVVADGNTFPVKRGTPPPPNPAVTVVQSMERSARQGLQPAVTVHAVRSIEKESRAPATQRMTPAP